MPARTPGLQPWSWTALLAFLLLAPTPAHAYLDPGTGIYLVHVLLAAGATVLYAARDFIGGMLGIGSSSEEEDEDDDEDDEDGDEAGDAEDGTPTAEVAAKAAAGEASGPEDRKTA